MLASLCTLISDIPVISVRGLNKGCWWTAYPFSSYWRGTHELDMQQAVRRYLPATGGVFWDLGTHFGFYTVSLARHLGPSGQVAAFDPNPEVVTEEESAWVDSIRLDDLVAAGKIREPDLVKVDVEGHAAETLQEPQRL